MDRSLVVITVSASLALNAIGHLKEVTPLLKANLGAPNVWSGKRKVQDLG